MIRKEIVKKIIALTVIAMTLIGFAACSKKTSETTVATSDTSASTEASTTAATTSLPQYVGPLPSNSESVTWTETAITEKVMYAFVSEGNFLRVRTGPGTDYDIAASLTSDMEVVVVAQTSNGWYKLNDGFYVSGDFLTATPSSSSAA